MQALKLIRDVESFVRGIHLSSVSNILSISSIVQVIRSIHSCMRVGIHFESFYRYRMNNPITLLPRSYLLQETFISPRSSPSGSGFIHVSQGGSPTVYTTRKIHARPMLRETYPCPSLHEPYQGSFPYWGIYTYIYIKGLSSLMQGTFLYIQVKSNIVDHKFHKSNC